MNSKFSNTHCVGLCEHLVSVCMSLKLDEADPQSVNELDEAGPPSVNELDEADPQSMNKCLVCPR